MILSKNKNSAANWFFNAPTPFVDFSKKEINHGPHNSGWGIAWLNNQDSWEIFKEGKGDVTKYHFDKINNINSEVIAVHLRWASVGNETSKNTQPLHHNQFIFMHNGTIERKELINYLNPVFKNKNKIKTDTDSEIYFLLIMQALEETGSFTKALKKTIALIKKYPYTGLNFIMSNGDHHYAYRDFDKTKKYFFNYYTLDYLIKNNQIIIASDSLSKEDWIPLKTGELIKIDKNLKIKKSIIIPV